MEEMRLADGDRHQVYPWELEKALGAGLPGTLVEGAANAANGCVWEREGEEVTWDINLLKS